MWMDTDVTGVVVGRPKRDKEQELRTAVQTYEWLKEYDKLNEVKEDDVQRQGATYSPYSVDVKHPPPGEVQVYRACFACDGKGQFDDQPCFACEGKGRVLQETREMTEPEKRAYARVVEADRRQQEHNRNGH